MSKRFTDNEKWEDAWFMELPDRHKLAYLYIIDRCDPVGVWKPNAKLLSFFVGEIDISELREALGSRVVEMSCGKWWVRKFIDFQYGVLDEESASKPIQSYVRLLKKHSLWIPYTKGIHTLKEKDKEKDKEKSVAADENFSIFWAAYPKKRGKGAAEKAWEKNKPSLAAVLPSLEEHKNCNQWKKDDGQFIPNPATWLNEKRWEDVVSTQSNFDEIKL